MKVQLTGILLLSVIVHCSAQNDVTKGFTKTPAGLWYKIVTDAGKSKAQVGYIIKINAVYLTNNDSIIFSTYEHGMGPIQQSVTAPTFRGDPMEGYVMLGEGDSAIFLMPADSAYKNQEYPPFAKPGDFIKIGVNVLSAMSKEEYERKKAEEAKVQTDMEAKTIEEYLAKNNLQAQRTPSGIYYIIKEQGTGPKAEAGKMVSVSYVGKYLDGRVFETSRAPYTFQLGKGKVIKGWDEGLTVFNMGGKGTLVIPSAYGYGSRGQGQIGPNTILVFDVEMVEVK